MFGFNLVALVKEEILKYKDKAGHPKVIDLLDKVDAGLKTLNSFVSHLDANDVAEILALLPASVKAKFPPNLIAEVSVAVVELPQDIAAAEVAIVKLETELEA